MGNKRLSDLLFQGWTIDIGGVFAVEEAPLSQEKVDQIMKCTNGKTTHIVFLSPPDGGQGIYYPITDEKELNLAQSEEEAGRQIIAYKLRITCGAKSLDGEVWIGNCVENIRTLTGWEIEIKKGEKEFDVFFNIEGDNKPQGYAKIDEVEEVLLALSIKNKIGFEIKGFAWGPMFAAQPFPIWVGPPVRIPQGISRDDIQRIRHLHQKGSGELLRDLSRFYGQLTESAKIVFGFAMLEEYFDEKPEHILNDNELEEVISRAIGIKSIFESKQKQERLREVLSNPTFMSKKNRNKRISATIAKLLASPEESVYSEIKKISKLRATLAHSNKRQINGLSDVAKFIEDVIFKYLNS